MPNSTTSTNIPFGCATRRQMVSLFVNCYIRGCNWQLTPSVEITQESDHKVNTGAVPNSTISTSSTARPIAIGCAIRQMVLLFETKITKIRKNPLEILKIL